MKFIWPCSLPVHIKDPDPVYTYLFSWVWIRAIRTKSATLLNINYKTTANLCEYQLLTSTCSREFWMQYRLWMIFLMGSSSSSSSSSWIAASSSSWACRASASRPDSVHDWTCSSCTRKNNRYRKTISHLRLIKNLIVGLRIYIYMTGTILLYESWLAKSGAILRRPFLVGTGVAKWGRLRFTMW